MTNPHEAALEAALEACILAAPTSEYGVCSMMVQAAITAYLTAMREAGPSEAMISAGQAAAVPYAHDCAADYVAAIYSAMIAAAQEGA